MDDISGKQAKSNPAFDQRIQTENLAFNPEELIACGGCGRMNPPNRLKCIYCARELAIEIKDAAAVKTNQRKLELWERGFNVVFVAKIAGAAVDTARIAQLLSLEIADLTTILDVGTPLPLARVESESDAAFLQSALDQLGLKCLLVSDLELAAERLPVRLKGIDFFDGCFSFKAFNTGKVTEIASINLDLIVPGLITASRVDAVEKKRRHRPAKVIDEIATISDESVLDLYSREDRIGFRVHLAGFDFSCLGEDKGLLAVENLRLLIVAIKEHAPKAKLVNDYSSVRHALASVWEIEARRDPQGLQRSGFGKVEFGSVASTTNLNQFTKYSRLQWHLL